MEGDERKGRYIISEKRYNISRFILLTNPDVAQIKCCARNAARWGRSAPTSRVVGEACHFLLYQLVGPVECLQCGYIPAVEGPVDNV